MMMPEQNDRRFLIDKEQKTLCPVVLSKHPVICLTIRTRAVAAILPILAE
jgi:hypothetical protein